MIYDKFIIWIPSYYTKKKLNAYIITIDPTIQLYLSDEDAIRTLKFYRENLPFIGMYFPYKKPDGWVRVPIVQIDKR